MEFSRTHWANHGKGQETRAKILAELQQNPNISVAELSRLVGRCERQITRQLYNLRLEGYQKNFSEAPRICQN